MNTKRLLIAVAAAIVSTAAFANGAYQYKAPCSWEQSAPAIYFGIQGGYGITGWGHQHDIYKISNDKGLALRGFGGIDITKNFGLEAGITSFPSQTHITKFHHTKIDNRDVIADAVGKIQAHLFDNLSLYAKGGVDFIYAAMRNAPDINTWGPTYGTGMTYNFTKYLIGDVSWTRFCGNPAWNRRYIPDVDFFSVGFRLRFGVGN